MRITKFLFVGERPSQKAISMGVSWRDGRLAAKQLFDGLRKLKLDPEFHLYDNVFVPMTSGKESVCRNAIRRIRYHAQKGVVVVAMGQKVKKVLDGIVPFKAIVHPAARGLIRKKSRYATHLKEVLCG